MIGNNGQSNIHEQDHIVDSNLDRDKELERRRLRKERRIKREKARQKREEKKKYSIVDNQLIEEDGDFEEQQVLPATMISNFFENS